MCVFLVVVFFGALLEWCVLTGMFVCLLFVVGSVFPFLGCGALFDAVCKERTKGKLLNRGAVCILIYFVLCFFRLFC